MRRILFRNQDEPRIKIRTAAEMNNEIQDEIIRLVDKKNGGISQNREKIYKLLDTIIDKRFEKKLRKFVFQASIEP